MKQQTIIVSVVVLFVVAGGSFYGGTVYSASKAKPGGPGSVQGFAGRNAGAGVRAGGQMRTVGGVNATNGEIVSKDETSLTLKTDDGSSKVVLFSASTTVGEMTVGSMDSLTPGKTVMVMGKTETDGSITATMVQIRAAGDVGVFGRPGGPVDGGAPSEPPQAQE